MSFLKQTFIDPIKEFIHDSRSIGILLLVCTAISLVIANLSFGEKYLAFWNAEFHLAHNLYLPHSLLHFINDGLMALFFFLAGMEIKHEMLEGELASPQRAALPVAAAIGGMIAPAIIFSLFNKATVFQPGWGIPTATDIAFSLGVASLLGKRVPDSLKIFLTALAIIDDLGAIVIIALFYGSSIKLVWLAASLCIIAFIYFINKKMRFGWLQIALGVLLWYCVFNSGVHATIAGVLFALLVPGNLLTTYCNKLHHLVNFAIMPLFALANTAIIFPDNPVTALTSTLSLGIIAGLFIGKPLGIYTASYIVIKKKWAALSSDITQAHLVGAGVLAGIGFTMSIFISTLAFSDPAYQDIAKVAVLAGSVASMIAGYFWLRSLHTRKQRQVTSNATVKQ
ncbi:Na+/H+ antiporter NhaA [Danxiaibacter flavus]|uniref:Na(+)/H(+) antiporter NhaA n=1 Tax=Danxiaibacter flavus TaxID=3049108 RepID=A0ABV3Z9R4_9BACT|nr:Na+/H+ antiporter NhaA [Chitinophagaceae bacterium DXS]